MGKEASGPELRLACRRPPSEQVLYWCRATRCSGHLSGGGWRAAYSSGKGVLSAFGRWRSQLLFHGFFASKLGVGV
jgi:hypothetical protein